LGQKNISHGIVNCFGSKNVLDGLLVTLSEKTAKSYERYRPKLRDNNTIALLPTSFFFFLFIKSALVSTLVCSLFGNFLSSFTYFWVQIYSLWLKPRFEIVEASTQLYSGSFSHLYEKQNLIKELSDINSDSDECILHLLIPVLMINCGKLCQIVLFLNSSSMFHVLYFLLSLFSEERKKEASDVTSVVVKKEPAEDEATVGDEPPSRQQDTVLRASPDRHDHHSCAWCPRAAQGSASRSRDDGKKNARPCSLVSSRAVFSIDSSSSSSSKDEDVGSNGRVQPASSSSATTTTTKAKEEDVVGAFSPVEELRRLCSLAVLVKPAPPRDAVSGEPVTTTTTTTGSKSPTR
jgi:hypothetical protein